MKDFVKEIKVDVLSGRPEKVLGLVSDYYYRLNGKDREKFGAFLYNFVWDFTANYDERHY